MNMATYADPGPAPPGKAIAQYDITTGEIVVSIDGVNNWYIESASNGLTGDVPILGLVPGALPSDTDSIIGETAFAVATAIDHSLGNVAATFLPGDDLTINWNAGLGAPLQTQRIYGPLTPPPFARINGPFLIDLANDPLNITLDASDSFAVNFEPRYSWDLDGQPGFEVSTSLDDTLDIADVVATFGGVGVYPVGVSVSDAGGTSSAYTTVTIINTPEPTTLRLAGLGIVFAVSSSLRRKSIRI